MNAALRIELRVTSGRNSEPSAAVLDSQSVKTTETPGVRGYDAGKKINGRKRHVLVDGYWKSSSAAMMSRGSKSFLTDGLWKGHLAGLDAIGV